MEIIKKIFLITKILFVVILSILLYIRLGTDTIAWITQGKENKNLTELISSYRNVRFLIYDKT